MANMSYCRFQNTLVDLGDCIEALDAILEGDYDEPLSDSELRAANKMIAEIRSLDLDGIDLALTEMAEAR